MNIGHMLVNIIILEQIVNIKIHLDRFENNIYVAGQIKIQENFNLPYDIYI